MSEELYDAIDGATGAELDEDRTDRLPDWYPVDPDSCLVESLELAASILEREDSDGIGAPIDGVDAARLAELVIALDQWLRRGGFLPDAWKV